MKRRVCACWGALAFAAATWAADFYLEPAPGDVGAWPETDATHQLAWDSGVPYWLVAWHTGKGSWVGNDFDVSTLKTFAGIKKIRFYTGPAWPNGRWDGMRWGIYAFNGGAPGSRLKGPTWAVGTTPTYGWNDYQVGWVLPTGVHAFVAACEQYYDYPNCDPFLLDNRALFRGHSWIYFEHTWRAMSTSGDPYRNLMLRVVVDNEQNPGVTPASFGRVKVMYY